LDGHELALKFSNNASKPSDIARKRAMQVEPNEECTKLIVRNLPFEATRKDLKQLFA
jgi:multiple RNA-binding domain-containing protein 1